MIIQKPIINLLRLNKNIITSNFRAITSVNSQKTRLFSTKMENDQPVPTNNNDKQEIKEGTANMLYDTKVFYNKVQVLNRDLSIQVIKLFSEKVLAERNERYQTKLARYEELSKDPSQMKGKNNELKEPRSPRAGITILDALSASGLRSIRYLKEIPLAEHVTINDLSIEATRLAKENCIRNEVPLERVRINNADATMLMYENRDPLHQFDVIDLDPYGTAAPFLDAAVQSVADGGLLCITCTDMTVLGGKYPEVCFYKYNSMPVRGRYLHELSLRMLLHTIDMTANKYKRYIVPWLSMSIDYYVRVFVRVFDSAAEVKNACLKRMHVLQCQDCPTYVLQPLGQFNPKNGNYNAATMHSLNNTGTCPTCDSHKFKLGGPYYSSLLHDSSILDTLLTRLKVSSEHDLQFPVPTKKRLLGLLTVMAEENTVDLPLFYSLPEISSAVQSGCPTNAEFRAALGNAGYNMVQFHHEATAIKTNAPSTVIWDIMRTYKQLHPTVANTQTQKEGEEASEGGVDNSNSKSQQKKNNKKQQQQQKKQNKQQQSASASSVQQEDSVMEVVDDAVVEGETGEDSKAVAMSKQSKQSNAEIAQRILSKAITTEIDFTIKQVHKVDRSVVRFPLNPGNIYL